MFQKQITDFTERNGRPEYSIVSPARVNIIGEHTDYCGGRVLPFAIAESLIITGKRCDNDTTVYSHLYDQELTLRESTTDLPSWSRFILSAIKTLKNVGYTLDHAHIMIGGDIPAGAGISSSSALTCGVLKILDKLFELEISDDELIRYASISENINGVLGGIMDQSCIVKAKEGHALLLDCQNNESSYITLGLDEFQWLLINSGVSHNLVETDYNQRSEECSQALTLLEEHFGPMHFRDLKKEHLDYLRMHNAMLSRRVRHFFMEEKRVNAMLRAIDKKDGTKMGRLLNECQYSLSHLYEVSCKEIDYLVDALQELPDVLGARMIGGGFGGAVLCLINKSSFEQVMSEIKPKYYSTFKIELSHHLVSPQDGLKVISHA